MSSRITQLDCGLTLTQFSMGQGQGLGVEIDHQGHHISLDVEEATLLAAALGLWAALDDEERLEL